MPPRILADKLRAAAAFSAVTLTGPSSASKLLEFGD